LEGRHYPKCIYCGKEIGYGYTHCNKCKVKDRTKEHWEKIHLATKKTMTGKMPKNIMREGKFNNIVRGFFNINGKKMFFRSKWEANYALYLDFLVKQKQISKWEYEADVFIFEKIKLGTRSYRPDFKIFNNNGNIEYHEVKGWLMPRNKTQFKRMSKYYPDIKLIIIDGKCMRDVQNKVGKLCGMPAELWERKAWQKKQKH